MSFAHFVSLVPVAVLTHRWHSVEGDYSYSLDGTGLGMLHLLYGDRALDNGERVSKYSTGPQFETRMDWGYI